MMYENKGGTELDTEISDVEHLVSTVRLFGLFVPATSKNLKILLAYRMLHAKDFVLAYNVLSKQLPGPNSSFCSNSSKTDQAEQLAVRTLIFTYNLRTGLTVRKPCSDLCGPFQWFHFNRGSI